NTHILKLLVKYLKKQGKKIETDLFKHMVPCTMNLQLVWNFFTLTDFGKNMLDVIAEHHHCKVEVILSGDDQFKEFFIFQVLNTQFYDESDVKDFIEEILNSVYEYAQESLSIESFEIDPRIQDDVRERINGRKELASIWIEWIGEDKLILYIVCHKDRHKLVLQIIREVIADATRSINSHKEIVYADFMWQTVMTRFEYLKEIYLKFPSIDIIHDTNKNAFMLKGPRNEVKAAAGHLEELLKMAHTEVHEKVFSPGYQFDIFASSEMCSYIDKSLPKLPVVWIPNHQTKEINLFSRDPDLLKGMDKSISGCIEEKLYPLLNTNTKLPSEKICLLEKLKKKHKGRIVISRLESPPGVLVTAAGDIFGGVDAEVQKILSNKRGIMHPKTCVSETPNGRDGKSNYKSEFGASNSDVEKTNLPSEISDSEHLVADQKTVPAVSGVSKMLKYGRVDVQAKLGTFENESYDCLLVFWEKQCLFNISDKNHILRSAGSKVTQRWREHRNSRWFHQGVVLVTPGGNLSYTEIIHVASDISNINNAAKAGLTKADRETMKTVVVPVTHDDSFQKDVTTFCIEILKAVRELSTKLKFVQSVTLIIQGLHTFPSFNEVFEQQSRMYGSEKKTGEQLLHNGNALGEQLPHNGNALGKLLPHNDNVLGELLPCNDNALKELLPHNDNALGKLLPCNNNAFGEILPHNDNAL
ncbi:hypothetical protein ACJMK2_006864, partial [Sinanodonta woodiana]